MANTVLATGTVLATAESDSTLINLERSVLVETVSGTNCWIQLCFKPVACFIQKNAPSDTTCDTMSHVIIIAESSIIKKVLCYHSSPENHLSLGNKQR